MTQAVPRTVVVAVPDTGAYYMSCLGAVLHLLMEQEPRPDTIIHVDYHDKDISLDPGNKEGYIPPGAEMHIDWATWLGKELDDDDTLELWVSIDRDGWEVMRIEGPEGDVTEVTSSSAWTSPSTAWRAAASKSGPDAGSAFLLARWRARCHGHRVRVRDFRT